MIDNTALENKLQALKIPGRIVSVSDNDFYTNYEISFNDDITPVAISYLPVGFEQFLSSKG